MYKHLRLIQWLLRMLHIIFCIFANHLLKCSSNCMKIDCNFTHMYICCCFYPKITHVDWWTVMAKFPNGQRTTLNSTVSWRTPRTSPVWTWRYCIASSRATYPDHTGTPTTFFRRPSGCATTATRSSKSATQQVNTVILSVIFNDSEGDRFIASSFLETHTNVV